MGNIEALSNNSQGLTEKRESFYGTIEEKLIESRETYMFKADR
jgi:hypothetical protein